MSRVGILVQNQYDSDPRVRRKAEALAAAGYTVDVYALRGARPERRYILNGVNVRTFALGKKRGSRARYAFEYLAFFLWAFVCVSFRPPSRRYAVVEANTLPDFLVFAGVVAKWTGTKLVLDMHEITPEFYISKYGLPGRSRTVRLLQIVEKLSIDAADRVITINEPIQELLTSRGLPRAKSTVIMNAVDERTLRAGAVRGPQRSTATFVMMYHGTLTVTYGLDIAIAALALARTDFPGAELWILGHGPEKERLAQLARARGVASAVRFCGTVPPTEVFGWLTLSDVGVLPMRRDVFLDLAFPNKLSEFIVAGKTALVPRLRAIRHYFDDDALAYFEPGDPTDLARQIVRLGRHPEARAALAARAQRAYEPICWDVMKTRYLELMAQLVTGPREQRLAAVRAATRSAARREAA